METMYQSLQQYGKTDYYPFHMPGHKRNMQGRSMEEIYQIDITEIEGFDNLHHPEGMILRAMERASKLYHCEKTYYLVNGSTCGILSAISATVATKGKILLARNCHKAAYNAVYLRELEPIYLYPEIDESSGITGGINPQDVRTALQEEKEIQAIFITSPSYDGVVSNIEAIAEIAHEKGIPLLVDEAHGAHFGMASYLPKSGIYYGADIVIHSVHKTLPAFTQTALLHVSGNLVQTKVVERYLGIYQSSSPSYLLMSGIDQCVRILETEGAELFRQFEKRLQIFYETVSELKQIQVVDKSIIGKNSIVDFDLSKIIISVKNAKINGNQLNDILYHKYHLQMEMVAESYVLAITTIMDTEVGFQRLGNALMEIDRHLEESQETGGVCYVQSPKGFLNLKNLITAKLSITEALLKEWEEVTLQNSVGRISAEYLYQYPPGIPIVVPGELISECIMELVIRCKEQGLSIQGTADYAVASIRVVK